MKNYRATYPCGYSSVRKARHALIAFAGLCGFRNDELVDIESAAGEALANAAEHGDRAASAGFSVDATCDDADLIIEIKDHGAGFDADAVVLSVPEPWAVRGHGIHLMRMLMDEVAYTERGTRVRLVKRAT